MQSSTLYLFEMTPITARCTAGLSPRPPGGASGRRMPKIKSIPNVRRCHDAFTSNIVLSYKLILYLVLYGCDYRLFCSFTYPTSSTDIAAFTESMYID